VEDDRAHPSTVRDGARKVHRVRIALAQVDSQLGDLDANTRRARDVVSDARAGGADLVVFPELQLSGYALGRTDRETSCSPAEAAEPADGMAALIGFHERDGDRRYNSAMYVEDGLPLHVHRKLYLAGYAPFEEDRLFEPGQTMRAFDTALGRMAVLICNDAWQPVLASLAVYDGAEILLMPSCSSNAVTDAEPYWPELIRFYARILECYVVFVNRVGDEAGFTYWGGSHVVDPTGEVVAEAPRHQEALVYADVDLGHVARRRSELPLVGGDPRFELLQTELTRLAAETTTTTRRST
jgi:predicted amidohydrolase